MSLIPDYWLPRPPLDLDAGTVAGFERLYNTYVQPGTGQAIPYDLAAPRWQFLAYLGEHYPLMLHGSGDPNIRLFEPRLAGDMIDLGNSAAVYASPDGVWPMYYAIVDREHYNMTLINACVRIQPTGGEPGEPYYFFSISQTARVQAPWRSGVVYLLPGATFTPQAPLSREGMTVHIAQAQSPLPVAPLARLAIQPDDFPFLAQIRGHDDTTIWDRARADPDAFPWLDGEA